MFSLLRVSCYRLRTCLETHVLLFQGPRGRDGDPGVNGAQGIKGEPGEIGNVGRQGQKGSRVCEIYCLVFVMVMRSNFLILFLSNFVFGLFIAGSLSLLLSTKRIGVHDFAILHCLLIVAMRIILRGWGLS